MKTIWDSSDRVMVIMKEISLLNMIIQKKYL